MSETIKIKSNFGNYTVIVGDGIYRNSNNKYLIDSNLMSIHKEISVENFVSFDAVESKKTLASVADVIERLRRQKTNRSSILTVVGGGITQDVGTFVASVFMRGIQWELIPTTLLSMVDSCIGGKSSINVGEFKNIAGNFFPPNKIIIDTKFCSTLSEKQIIEGLSEAIKICYAHSELSFNKFINLTNEIDSLGLHRLDFSNVVSLSLNCKKEFIEEDEFDTGIRLLLNFGHTFGHAIESSCDYKIPHGIAVALGMLCAYSFSIEVKPSLSDSLKAKKLIEIIVKMLRMIPSISKDIEGISLSRAMSAFESDKKHSNEDYFVIAFKENGDLERMKLIKNSINTKKIKNAFISVKENIFEI
jgi:3-dehydroquinate synthase